MALVDAKVIWRANNFGLLQIRGFGCVLGSRRALHRDSGVNRVSTGTIVLSARLSWPSFVPVVPTPLSALDLAPVPLKLVPP